MPFAESADGVRLHYALHDFTDPWSDAPLLILQHGFGRSSKYWYRHIPYLCRFYRVACPDLRGLGEFGRPQDLALGLTLDNYLADFLAIADACKAETFHFAGESSGGMLGLALAARHPERIRTLTLFNSSLTIRADSQKKYAHGHASWEEAIREMGPQAFAAAQNADPARFPPGTPPGLVEWATDLRGRSDPEVMIAFSRFARTLELAPLLPKIAAPVLGIYPEQGAVGRSGQKAVIERDIRNLTMVHLPGEHAMRWLLMPATTSRYVLEFIAGHDNRPCSEE